MHCWLRGRVCGSSVVFSWISHSLGCINQYRQVFRCKNNQVLLGSDHHVLCRVLISQGWKKSSILSKSMNVWVSFQTECSLKLMLTHTYPHKSRDEKDSGDLMQSPGWQLILCVLDVWSGDLQGYKKYGHTWYRMSLLRPDIIKQHKPDPPYSQCSKDVFYNTRKCHCNTFCSVFKNVSSSRMQTDPAQCFCSNLQWMPRPRENNSFYPTFIISVAGSCFIITLDLGLYRICINLEQILNCPIFLESKPRVAHNCQLG